MGTVTEFIFLGSKMTLDSNCSYEIKRRLLLKRKAMTNLNSILKSRDIILLTKIHIVKAIVLPVFLPGESHGRRSLVGYGPRGRKESDTTELITLYMITGVSYHFLLQSGPITSWQIDGEKMETVTDFIFSDSKNHCGW